LQNELQQKSTIWKINWNYNKRIMDFIILVRTWPFMVRRKTACLVAYHKDLGF